MEFFFRISQSTASVSSTSSAYPMTVQPSQSPQSMPPKEDFFTSFSYEKEIERAKWYKDDLDKGGWNEVHRSPGHVFWIKTFPEDEIPISILSSIDLPLSVEMFMEAVDPKNLDKRNKWDTVFVDHEIVETYPDNKGVVRFMRSPNSFPFWDRSFLLFFPPLKEIDWFGKRAFIQIEKNAWHPSKPEGADGLVRATNGGNFDVIIPDENNPNAACNLFSLSKNNYNGWLPKKHIEWILGRKVPASFNKYLASMVEGYEKYFKQK